MRTKDICEKTAAKMAAYKNGCGCCGKTTAEMAAYKNGCGKHTTEMAAGKLKKLTAEMASEIAAET